MIQKLTPEEVLTQVSGWSLVAGRDAIRKSFRMKDFSETWGIMTRIALAAERLNHHPEWFNVYNRLDITLSTHDVNGLSQKDLFLAQHIDAIIAQH